MTERDDREWQSGYVVLPIDLGLRRTSVYRRCPACGGYFRDDDDCKVNVRHHGCQPEKAPGRPTTDERRR